MATNRDLLKEAIADAKAVKETAIANAKAALQEAFTPQLHSMFAMKLQEMEEEDLKEEGFGKMNADSDEGFSQGMDEKALDEENYKMDEIDLEELLRELEEEETAEGLYEAEEEEEESEEEEEESEEGEDEGEPLDLEDMTDEDLKSMIEDVIKDMMKSGEIELGNEEEEAEETGMEDEEEVDLAELLKEIEEMEDVEEGILDRAKKALYGDPMDDVKAFAKYLEDKGKDASMAQAIFDETDIAKKKEMVKNLDLDKFDMTGRFGKRTNDVLFSLGAITKEERDKNRGVGNLFPAGGGFAESAKMKAELDEALKTINALKSELNEINLLNAKLLYTNKIFKAKNLNENQKVKVLSSFDKATTVGEVKMVFETLNEGIKVSKNTIKENLGSASKAMVTPNAKKPIVESNDAFLRMQKLAGII
jgi:hypothetical protein